MMGPTKSRDIDPFLPEQQSLQDHVKSNEDIGVFSYHETPFVGDDLSCDAAFELPDLAILQRQHCKFQCPRVHRSRCPKCILLPRTHKQRIHRPPRPLHRLLQRLHRMLRGVVSSEKTDHHHHYQWRTSRCQLPSSWRRPLLFLCHFLASSDPLRIPKHKFHRQRQRPPLSRPDLVGGRSPQSLLHEKRRPRCILRNLSAVAGIASAFLISAKLFCRRGCEERPLSLVRCHLGRKYCLCAEQ